MPSDVRYYLERPKKGKPARITLFYQYRIGKFKYSTGEYILPEHWDKNAQRAKVSLLDIHAEYDDLNQLLDDLANEVRKIHRQFRKERRLLQLNNRELKKRLQLYQLGKPLEAEMGILKFTEMFIQDRLQSKSPNSIKQYRSTQKHLQAFFKSLNFEPGFEDINLVFFEMFRDYFFKLEPPQGDNNIHKNLSTLKLILSRAVKHQHTENTEFRHIRIWEDLGVKKEVADSIALDMVDLEKMYQHNFSHRTDLEETRDLFLIGCFTGLRISDWSKIQKDRIKEFEGKLMFEVFTQKSKKLVFIPLHPYVKAIGEHYDWNLPVVPHNVTVNRHLKEIGKAIGFTEVVSYVKRIRGKEEFLQEPKYKRITTHTARRSFATNGYLAKISVRDLMAVTGHSQERDFMNYIKAPLQTRAKRVAETDFFTQWKAE